MRKKDKDATAIGDIIVGLIKKIDEEKVVGEEKFEEIWKEIVGEKASRSTKPSSLYRKKLKILVKNPGWIHALTLDKRRILRRLQSRFGKEIIKEVSFKSGEF